MRFVKGIVFCIFIGLFSGCGSDDSGGDTNKGDGEISTANNIGYLIDSAVEGASYTSTKGDSGATDTNGTFRYTTDATITFKIGSIEIGDIDTINSDKKVFIQDIVGVERTDTNNSEVLKIARFLQSLDDDGDSNNGIKIDSNTIDSLKNENKILKELSIEDIETIVTTKVNKTFKTEFEAKLHIDNELKSIGLTPQNSSDGNIDKKYYGKWVYLHDAQELNILSTTTLDNFEAVDDNLIKIDKDGTTYSLLRSSVANINISGKVEVMDSSTRGLRDTADIGDIDVILQNILDANIKAEVKTDKNGGFENNTLPTGTYKLTAKDSTKKIEKTVEIKNEDEDLGVFKLTGDGVHNFKAELILDQEFVYGDKFTLYTGKIRVHNISDTIGLGLNYEVNATDEDIKEFTANIASANGSVLPKSYKDIPLNFKFNPIYFNQKTINIDVKIQDVNNNIWKDSFSFEIYKGSIDINIATKSSSIKGYIIMPNTNSIKNIDIENGTISLPLLKDKKYHLVLSNPSLENETAYSIGVNKATEDLTSFSATASYEPNDKESQSNDIAIGESIISYLHFGDLDYWTIFTVEDPTTAGESQDVIIRDTIMQNIMDYKGAHGHGLGLSSDYISFGGVINNDYKRYLYNRHTNEQITEYTGNLKFMKDDVLLKDESIYKIDRGGLLYIAALDHQVTKDGNTCNIYNYDMDDGYLVVGTTCSDVLYKIDNVNNSVTYIKEFADDSSTKVAIDGNYIVVSGSDKVMVYKLNKSNNDLTLLTTITEQDTNYFGINIMIHDNYIVVGQSKSNGTETKAYVYKIDTSNDTVSKIAELTSGNIYDNSDASTYEMAYGSNGAMNGDYIALSDGEDGMGSSQGTVYLYRINKTYDIVHFVQKIEADDHEDGDEYGGRGDTIFLNGDTLLIGSPNSMMFEGTSGSSYIYKIQE